MVAGGLGELGAAGGQRVLGERCDRLDPLDKATGELSLVEGERGAHEHRQERGVVGVGAGAGDLVELGKQRFRLLRVFLGEQ